MPKIDPNNVFVSASVGAITELTPGVTATDLGKAEDAAHTSGDTGVLALGIRNDAAAARSGTDADYTGIATDSVGRVLTKTQAQTATVSAVADSATSVQLLAASNARLGATIANDSSAALYLKLGITASLTSYTARLVQYGYYEVPFGYVGRVDGIWFSDPDDGAARITELT